VLVTRRGAAPSRVFRDARLWRAVDVFRAATLIYAIAIFVPVRDEYRHPVGAVAVLAVMAGWTVYLHVRRVWQGRPVEDWLLAADLALTAVLILSTLLVDDPARISRGEATLPSIWAAASVGALAVGRGWRAGLLGALVIGTADFVEVWPRVASGTIDSLVQLVLLGTVIGYIVELYTAGRRDLARAVALEAASRERERLAADIHDSVLQVLAYVQRRGVELGGDSAELGRLAGEQEARLRAMVAARPVGAVPEGEADVKALLDALGRRDVVVAGPTGAVLLTLDKAGAVAAAVAAALDNVERHAGEGARAWVLVEEEPDVVTVTVRDDGEGFGADRLTNAEREGRLGFAAAIRGRVEEVGGTVDVVSTPGEGTEIELRVPRRSQR
jgi:signal transduction histidine kinase